MEIEKEKIIDNYPLPITIEGTKIILNQLINCICKIENRNGSGTGFFCSINEKVKALITNNHVINENIINENKTIRVTLNDDKDFKIINLENKKIYTSEKYDVTIIEIHPEKENITQFLELDKEILEFSRDRSQSVYILQYPRINIFRQKAAVSYGIIKNLEEEFNLIHYCCTEYGSSGSLIINLLNNKLVGIHKENFKSKNYNRGTLLKNPINEYLKNYFNIENINQNNLLLSEEENNINQKNEINLILKIDEKDINKNIYFLNRDNDKYNTEEEYKNSIEYFNKILNKSKIEIFINEIKYDNKKYFKPKRVGLYEIKLIFKLYITNLSYMFYGCSNITNINLSSFVTKNIINMSSMFYNCTNLIEIDLSSFDTNNVTNMNSLFYNCSNLTKIDLSSFHTNNVTNMSSMFCNCSNLTNINVTSFNTNKVINMSSMFCNCSNLKNLNVSSFDTMNVTNMSSLFYNCSKLSKIDLTSFDTKNVINMNGIFSGCSKLKYLDLSSFDTGNVTSMIGLFSCCSELTNLDLSSFDTKNVNDMSDIIFDCFNLKKVKINNITSNSSLITQLIDNNINILDKFGNNFNF